MIELTEEEKLVLDTVRRIADNELKPRAAEIDEKAVFPEHAPSTPLSNGALCAARNSTPASSRANSAHTASKRCAPFTSSHDKP